VTNLGWYAVAIAAGTIVTTIALLIAKRPLQEAKQSGVSPSL